MIDSTDLHELSLLPVEVECRAESTSVRAETTGGVSVTLEWGSLTRDIRVRFSLGDNVYLDISREKIEKIRIAEVAGILQVGIWTESEDLKGKMSITLGESPVLVDELIVG